MKGIVIYDSSHGNTKKVAETISETLLESGIEVDAFYVKEIKKLRTKEYDFLVIGSPTRWGTMSFTVKRFLSKVNEEWKNKPFISYDTELSENIEKNEGSAAGKISEKLKEKQMNQLLPVLKTIVSGIKGPLQEGEIERTKDYARKLAVELKR